MKSKNVIIYCDGACSGNPGPGGWGSLVVTSDLVAELGGGASATTNNRMEMTAALAALAYCVKNYSADDIKNIQVFTDSVYVIRGITQWIFGWKKRGWKNAANEAVSNQDIWEQLDKMVLDVKNKLNTEINWNFVKGHSGVAGNERCDEIAVAYSKISTKNTTIDLYKGAANAYIFDVNTLPESRGVPEMKKKNEKKSEGDKKQSIKINSTTKSPAWYLSYVNGVLSKHATWRECEAVVKGRPAKFKKVTNLAEEAAIKKSWGL